MAIKSVDQNRQFYVVSELVTSEPQKEGQLKLGKTPDGKQFFFKHYGKGGLTRTDLIDTEKVSYAKLTAKEDMQRKLKKAVVTLSEEVNDGNPIAGQDYVLRVTIFNYLAPGDACQLVKSAAVHATKAMATDKEAFYKKMAESLTRNFSREVQPLLTFEGSAEGITITEVGDQPWRLGIYSQEPVNFSMTPTTVKFEGEEVTWGEVEYGTTDTTVGNGKEVADLEYFCSAERGDMFRNMGYPYNLDVKMMVDPDKEYDMIDLHYAYSGDGVQVHKSEKDLTFVSATAGVLTSIKAAIAALGITFEGTTEG
jgi:hypothetical protein